jgi:hypothetical protein
MRSGNSQRIGLSPGDTRRLAPADGCLVMGHPLLGDGKQKW